MLFLEVLHIVDINLLSNVICKYFVPFPGLAFFIQSIASLDHQVFILMPNYLFLFLLPVTLVSYPSDHCETQCHEAFPLSFRSVAILSLMFVSVDLLRLTSIYNVR